MAQTERIDMAGDATRLTIFIAGGYGISADGWLTPGDPAAENKRRPERTASSDQLAAQG